MDIERAKEILSVLANGVNPITGEILPEDDSCNQIDVVRAINIVLRELNGYNKRPSRVSGEYENAGKPWSSKDDKELCRMFDEGYSKEELCSHFKRSQGALAARLVRLGWIEDRKEFRRRQ
ncbi:MAG: hypothetical protein E7334_00190 [Clostridiales bacterium]|nr:hypothetical protein [Clostridiales bacterium]